MTTKYKAIMVSGRRADTLVQVVRRADPNPSLRLLGALVTPVREVSERAYRDANVNLF